MVDEQTDIIAKATLAAERLKEENDRMEAAIKRAEAWEARMILGGRSNAGVKFVSSARLPSLEKAGKGA